MDTNGDLGIMSHVGHLRRTPELSKENVLRKVFSVMFKFHQMCTNVHKCPPNVTPVCLLVCSCDIFSEENRLWIMEFSG